MKSIIYLFTLLLFISSCTSDDNGGQSQNSINPPEWIQGKWLNDRTQGGYEFKPNAFCTIFGTINSVCIDNELANSPGAEVTETIQTDQYILVFNSSIINETYHFKKKNASELIQVIASGEVILTKQ